MSRGASEAITVRRPVFDFSEVLDPVVIEDHPEESFNVVGLSLLLPYLEPYLIRTMRAAKKHVTDAALARDLESFNAQEGQHYRQHVRFNEAIRFHNRDRLEELEQELEADYRRFTETKSLRFNLAYAEGFEAFTCALARFSLEMRSFERMRPAVGDLFAWHLVEEVEHRRVAFDVYEHVCGGYFYRLAVGLFAQWHLNRFVLRAAAALKDADRASYRAKYGGTREAWRRIRPHLWRMVCHLLPKVFATYMPWYTPHRITMPPEAMALVERYASVVAPDAGGKAAETT